MRQCPRCQEAKPLKDYRPCGTGYCSSCRKAYASAYKKTEAGRAKFKEYRLRRAEKIKSALTAAMKSRSCCHCGSQYSPQAMDWAPPMPKNLKLHTILTEAAARTVVCCVCSRLKKHVG